MENKIKKPNMMREMVSGANGIISSKRVMGVVTLAICLGCTIWLVISEGGTMVVENLLQTLMIMAAALLGISSVTGIWRKGTDKTIKQEDIIEEQTVIKNLSMCDKCIYNPNNINNTNKEAA